MLEVKFIPPVIPKGTVSIEMDIELASKLRALIAQCNGGTFYKLYVEMDKLPIDKLALTGLSVYQEDTIDIINAAWEKQT